MRHDVTSSVVVFLVALPLCMGIAIASGASVAAGLATGIVGGIVVGMLADKDIDGMLRAIEPCIDDWHLADVPGPRGATAQHVAEQLQTVNSRARLSSYPSVAAAHGAARELARDGDRLVVFGCFYAAREALCLES